MFFLPMRHLPFSSRAKRRLKIGEAFESFNKFGTLPIVGYYAGMQGKSQPGLAALEMAVNRQFPADGRGQGLALMSDHGCQPTSTAFMRACGMLGLHQAVTSSNHPKGHADHRAGHAHPESIVPVASGMDLSLCIDHSA